VLEGSPGKIETWDVTRLAVVGAGIVGLAVARELLTANPESSVVVIER
jgi:L-2-hydroxyglutarate oxidase LhgO